MIIAIDGPAASGKGTLARNLAEKLDYAYLDTGALYRLAGKAVLDSGGDPSREEDAVKAAAALREKLNPASLRDPALRTDAIGQAASQVAKYPGVRAALLDFQRDFARNPIVEKPVCGVILDGRDIGTVICPEAPVKLFVTASTDVRARRRYAELTAKGIETTPEDVLADMIARDERDSLRDTAPLKPAPDAHILDTSAMSAAEVFQAALSLVKAAEAKAVYNK
jgi:cytidylate kinase